MENQELQTRDITLSEAQKMLCAMIWKNESLRAEILKNPKEVIERELGIQFNEGIEVRVIDQISPKNITFVLPHHLKTVYGVEFTEAQLDAIAGGAKAYANTSQTGGTFNLNINAGTIGQMSVVYAPQQGATTGATYAPTTVKPTTNMIGF
jgi:hypothetical protein